ncbi:MAG: VgrG-related protein [Synechococcales bacterium]|nr:VgrG-related protein [Synechococcales bacterium]
MSSPKHPHTAEPKLQIEGKDAPEALMNDILHLVVEESISRPGMFTLMIKNAAFPGKSGEKIWEHESLFKIGHSIKVGFRSSATESQEFSEESEAFILDAEITAIETHFTPGSQAPIIIRGYDISHRLHRGRYNRSFQNMTDSDIVNRIIGEVGISGKVATTSPPHDYIFQENQTNMEFLRERAGRNGFELFVRDGKLHFRKPTPGDTMKLTWLQDLTAFQVRVTSAEQVKAVEVRGWDYQNKQSIVATQATGKAQTQTDYAQGRTTSSAFKEKPTEPKLIVVDQPVFTVNEAKTIAQALADELEGQFVHADAKAEGNPKIRPACLIELEKMGKYDGKYYVTETRHVFSERFYTTEFTVRGLRGGDFLAIAAPTTHLQPGQTFLVGIVTNNKDPQSWGRVRVKFPTLTEDHESNWARVITIGAGPQRGFDCLPEVNDEVLVGFEHGDIHRPYVIGNVWNGKDAPPEKVGDSVKDGKVRLRTFKTRTGHQMQFTEEDGSSKKGIQLKTVYGHQIYMNDSDRLIEIKTNGGHILKMDDLNRQIELKSATGHSIVLNDASASVSVKSQGNLSIEANANMTIKSNGPMTIQGAIIKLN